MQSMVTIAVFMGTAGLHHQPGGRLPAARSRRLPGPGLGAAADAAASARSSSTSCRARCGARAASRGQFKVEARLLIREHWTRERITLVVLGLICFYVTYVSYRNLKNFLPFVRARQDPPGRLRAAQVRPVAAVRPRPAPSCCTACSAPRFSAHVLSYVYLIFLPMVPVSVIIWLVWSRNVSFGYWYVTAQCICWTLGTASYYMIPTLGPNFAFAVALRGPRPTRGSRRSRTPCWTGDTDVRFDPLASGVQSVAGFASLHVADHPADGAGRRSTPCGTGSSRSSSGSTWASRCSRRPTSAGTTSPTTSPAR